MPSYIDHLTTSAPVKCICAHKCQCFSMCYRAENSHIKTALQDFGTAHVIKDPNKAFLVEITSIRRERERQSGTLNMSAVFSGLSQRRGLCKWFIACLHHGGTKEGRRRAFMRLAQSKLLLRVISPAEDISSQQDRENRKNRVGRWVHNQFRNQRK